VAAEAAGINFTWEFCMGERNICDAADESENREIYIPHLDAMSSVGDDLVGISY